MSRFFDYFGLAPPPRPSRGLLDSFWHGLQTTLAATLDETIPAGSTVALLDYPVHGNTGDHLIMLGTECWAARANLNVVGRWHADNFRFPTFSEDTIIVCHGGGNFGDLYRYQRHREQIIEAYPRHRIVILPQTIYYRSQDRLRESAARMRRHADLHVLVRDRRSLAVAEAAFPTCRPTLAPDMAAFLYPFDLQMGCEPSPVARREIFCLCRRDMERTNLASLPGLEDVQCLDWDDVTPMHRYYVWGAVAIAYLFGKAYSARWAADRWHAFCRNRAIRAARLMIGAQCVVSNRLHGHILACLLGLPNLLFDNTYGKCSDYFNAWHAELPFARLIVPDRGDCPNFRGNAAKMGLSPSGRKGTGTFFGPSGPKNEPVPGAR